MDVIKTSFIYSKLEENEEVQPIRVLKLYPSADFNHKIECELLPSSLNGPNRITYEAVSYA
jgi:hypothetical protein